MAEITRTETPTEVLQRLRVQHFEKREQLRAELDFEVGGGNPKPHPQIVREWIADLDSLLNDIDAVLKGTRSTI